MEKNFAVAFVVINMPVYRNYKNTGAVIALNAKEYFHFIKGLFHINASQKRIKNKTLKLKQKMTKNLDDEAILGQGLVSLHFMRK